MSLPVVFIHSGPIAYLYETVYQLKAFNPNTAIHLIGTKESIGYQKQLKHHYINQYNDKAEAFSGLYKHYSNNSVGFELFCIQRWFVLYQFMKENNIERCLHLDTDVLLFCNIDELLELYGNSSWTICGISGHSTIIRIDVLKELCDYIWKVYNQPDASGYMETLLKEYRVTVPEYNISDMTWLQLFAEEYPDKVINTWKVMHDKVCDASLAIGGDVFEMESGLKKIILQDYRPFFIMKENYRLIKALSLHFQGGSTKSLITKYVVNRTILFYVIRLYFKVQWYKYRIFNKLSRA
ncbi:MAG: hypothetical protein U0U66_07845 [Cytophagaceae bacterium]